MNLPLLETARLKLRGFTESDVPALVLLIGSPEVAATTLRIPHPYEQRHAREFLTSVPKENELRLAIERRSDGQLCGGIGLHPEPQHSRAELGYWLGVPFWGKGYATEAAAAVVRYGFEKLQLNRVFASHFECNVASRGVLLKIGMRYEGCMRKHIYKWGKYIDSELYAILRDEAR